MVKERLTRMNVAYLQADARYNNWLLKEINAMYVIEYTLERIKKLDCHKIVAGIYKCKENEPLIDVLKHKGVEIVLSEEEDVNSRFIQLMIKQDAEYAIRVASDLVLLDVDRTNKVLEGMKKSHSDFFYNKDIACVIPDIVKIDCLKQYEEACLKSDRYFIALDSLKHISRYNIPWPLTLLYEFRANSNETYRICKNVIEKQLDPYELSLKLARNLRWKENYLNSTGIYGSWILGNTYEDFFIDESMQVNPWWVKGITDIVQKKLSKDIRVFEWGSGNSTLFWSQNAGEVVSIEYDEEWYEKMKEIIPDNVRLELCRMEPNGDYCRKILEEKEKFDIILIDGNDRVRCVYNSLEKLKEKGIIIWDDTDREEYQEGYRFLEKHGYKQLELSGIVYGLAGMAHFTSVFYQEKNLLEL